MKHIGNLKLTPGATHSKKRIGRGPGSGHGGTATRGNKGAQSRSGYKSKKGFEGGQMPMHRRLPKFGFTNPFRKEYQAVNLETLQIAVDNGRIKDNEIDVFTMFELGIISKKDIPVKILGDGELKTALTVKADAFSATAKTKIEAAGGKVETNE